MQTENISTLQIHKLSQAQYDRELAAGNLDDNAIYLTPDEEIDLSNYATKDEVSGKADSDHTHVISDVTDLQTTLNSKSDASHVHTISDVTDLQTTLDSKSNSAHTHSEYMTVNNPVGIGSFVMNANVDSVYGDYSFTEGYLTAATGAYSHAAGYCTTAGDHQFVIGKYNIARDAPTTDGQDTTYVDAIFLVGNGIGDDDESRSNALRVSSGGRCYSDRFLTTEAADFAELFEWSDGNLEDDDRRGLFVALDGEKIKLADTEDDYIGIISGTPAFVGNSASEEWHDKYLTDVFGTRLSREVEIPDKVDENTGEIIVPAHTVTRFIINPEYDSSKPYIMRENRKEWATVGLCGQVVAVDDGTCVVGGYCKPSSNGVGTAADTGYRVMKRIDDTHIKVLVKC